MDYTLPTLTDDQLRDTGLIIVPRRFLNGGTPDLIAGYAAELYDRATVLRIPPPSVQLDLDDTAAEVELHPRAPDPQ